jgi:hypothetical protein
MSKQKPPKKKVVTTKKKVVTTSSASTEKGKSNSSTGKKTTVAASSRRKTSSESKKVASSLEFGRQNYMLMLAGIGLIAIGLLLMSGGEMPSPDVWDDSIIYSVRRTAIAPFVILLGLIVEVFAIFKKA